MPVRGLYKVVHAIVVSVLLLPAFSKDDSVTSRLIHPCMFRCPSGRDSSAGS